MISKDIIVIGGGAAGFFTAINAAEMNPNAQILILERGKEALTKVKVSGGGRCNVTHAEFLPKELSKNYPRGEKELRGPFHYFMTGDTMEWFEKRGVPLKIEEDGRIFPESNSSQTIIDCFLNEASKFQVQIEYHQAVNAIFQKNEKWHILTKNNEFVATKIVVATGSNTKIWSLLSKLGHKIVNPVPSLFTFNIKDERIKDLAGIATKASIEVCETKLKAEGALLVTHWGMSGPAILKLSAWGARILHELQYNFRIKINWLPNFSSEEIFENLKSLKLENPRQQVAKYAQFELPKRLWQNLSKAARIPETEKWAELNKQQIQQLVMQLTSAEFKVNRKSTFKEEFVTAGGVDLKEIDFKTFESKKCPNLYLVGEVLNIDAITGGFNFQNAWTGGFLAAKAITKPE